MPKKSASEKAAGLKELFLSLSEEERGLLRSELGDGPAAKAAPDGELMDTIAKLQLDVEALRKGVNVPVGADENDDENESGEKTSEKKSLFDKLMEILKG